MSVIGPVSPVVVLHGIEVYCDERGFACRARGEGGNVCVWYCAVGA